MKRFLPVTVTLAVALALLTLFTGGAWAQATDAAAQYDSFMSLFSNTAASWEGVLRGYASTIFWSLALIELIIVFMPLALRGSEIGELMFELIRYVLVIGFFWAVVTQGSVWGNAIVQSMRQAGAAAGGAPVGLSPSAVIATGFEIGILVTENISMFSPGVSIAFVMAWIVLILAFAYIAAMIAVALIESYVIIYGGVIFLGLGGSRFTRDYAITVLRYSLAVGAKLFVLTLIVNLFQGAFTAWASYWDETLTAATSLMGLAILAALITKMIPDLITSMITGQTSTSSPVGGMATTFLAAGAAATGVGLGMGAAGAAAAAESAPVSGAAGLANAMSSGLAGGSTGAAAAPVASSVAIGGPAGGGTPVAASSVGASAGGPSRAKAAATVNAAFRSTGTLSELVVPGMEGASAVGVAPQFAGPAIDLAGADAGPTQGEPALVIEGAGAAQTKVSPADDDLIDHSDPVGRPQRPERT